MTHLVLGVNGVSCIVSCCNQIVPLALQCANQGPSETEVTFAHAQSLLRLVVMGASVRFGYFVAWSKFPTSGRFLLLSLCKDRFRNGCLVSMQLWGVFHGFFAL